MTIGSKVRIKGENDIWTIAGLNWRTNRAYLERTVRGFRQPYKITEMPYLDVLELVEE